VIARLRVALPALATALALVLGVLGLATTSAEEGAAEARNVAANATPSASFTASHNNLNAVNDGTHSNSGAPETSYWGTWTATGRPESQFLQYDWIVPVQVDRTVVSFWTDVAPGSGANVTVPQSWELEYWDPTTAAWVPVPSPSGYGTSRTGANETTFDPVTTTRLRATFHAYPNGDGTSYSALGVSEWEVWGGIAEADPDTVIEVPVTHARTTPGITPELPGSLDVIRLNGRRTPVDVSWQEVDPATLVSGIEVEVTGDLAGLDRDALATIWVRETLATSIQALDDASVITTAGVRPALPSTVTASYDDGARDSGVAVVWEALSRADYAAEGFFAVAGAVEGTDLVPTAWVFVEPADGSTPTPAFKLATSPAEPNGAAGWFTSDVDLQVLPVDGAATAYEARIGEGDWGEVVDASVTIAGDGVHEVSVREAGAETAQTLTVRIDGTRPASAAAVAGRTVTLSASDETSGVERVEWRTDGEWTTYTEPVTVGDAATTFRHRAVDAAGNTEEAGVLELPAAELRAPVATVRPTVVGTPMVGRVLRARTGTWDVPDVHLSIQWLADGTPMRGATGTSYVVRRGDVGKVLAVLVTATKPQHAEGTARSASTARVAKAATRTRLDPARSKVRNGGSVRLSVRVSATGVVPAGKVRIYDRGRLVATLWLDAGGASTRVRLRGTRRHRLVATYAGTSWAAPSSDRAVVTVL
jgi:hypothetical protein